MGFEYIVCDSPAGIERGATMALHFADHAVIVTNPKSSVRDSDRSSYPAIEVMLRKAVGKRAPADNGYDPVRVDQGEMLSKEDVCDILAVNHRCDSESKVVLKALPDSQLFSMSRCGNGGSDAVARFLGEDRPLHRDTQKAGFVESNLVGVINAIFGIWQKINRCRRCEDRLQY